MEPKEAFKFCQYCGGQYEVIADDHFKCTVCGKHHFVAPSVGAGGLCLNANNELLLTRRGKDPFKGTWGVPAGFVDIHDETAEAALERELMEEVGIKVTDIKYFASCKNIYPFQGLNRPHLSLYYTCNIALGFEPKVQDEETTEVAWFTLDKIPFAEIGFPTTRKLVQQFVNTFQPLT